MEDNDKTKSFRTEGYSDSTFRKGVPSDGMVNYNGPVLTEMILAEMEVWARILPPLFEGIHKPNSALWELKRIEKEEERTGNDYTELKDTLRKCCPTSATVQDSIQFKDLRDAILERIKDISGIKSYMKNDYKQ